MDIFVPSRLYRSERGKRTITEMIKKLASTDIIFDGDESISLASVVESAREIGEDAVADYIKLKYKI